MVKQTFDVLGQHVDFEVDGIAGRLGAQGRDGERVRDDRDVEGPRNVVERGDGEADAVDGDRTLLDDVAQQLGRRCERHAGRTVGQADALPQRAYAVDMTLHDVTAEA